MEDGSLSGDNTEMAVDRLKKAALEVLERKLIQNGAVLHCFTGNFLDMGNFKKVGVTHLGIGPKVFYNRQLVIETDAPFLKLERDSVPNTFLVLLDVAEKVATLRETSLEHVLEVSYANALELFTECN